MVCNEYSPAERQNIVLSHLLKSQEPIKLLTLAKLLNVTEATISNDLDKFRNMDKKDEYEFSPQTWFRDLFRGIRERHQESDYKSYL